MFLSDGLHHDQGQVVVVIRWLFVGGSVWLVLGPLVQVFFLLRTDCLSERGGSCSIMSLPNGGLTS